MRLLAFLKVLEKGNIPCRQGRGGAGGSNAASLPVPGPSSLSLLQQSEPISIPAGSRAPEEGKGKEKGKVPCAGGTRR